MVLLKRLWAALSHIFHRSITLAGYEEHVGSNLYNTSNLSLILLGLQGALLGRVPPGVIQLGKRLSSLENLEQGGVRLFFEDGTNATADLVVGADGIRSVRFLMFSLC